MTYLVVVDDHYAIQEGIRARLRKVDDVDLVATFSSGRSFLSGLRRLDAVDVVLLDVSMPGEDGFSVLKRLQLRDRPPRVIMLSVLPPDPYALQAYLAGASAYVGKDAPWNELLKAIRDVHWHGRSFEGEARDVIEASGFDADAAPPNDAHGAAMDPRLSALSEQERRVLHLLCDGLDQKTIAVDLGVSPQTVSTYKSRLMRKLDAPSFTDLVREFGADATPSQPNA